MNSRIGNLPETSFDIVVIGGGIHGATIAWEAQRHGLKTLLVEKEDFGGAASASSLKVLHGGLRYLQHLDFRRMRESIRARREGVRLQPHLAHPQPYMMPTHGRGMRSRIAMRLALLVNDVVSFDRNWSLPEDRRFPAGWMMTQSEWEQVAGGGMKTVYDGAAVWYDGFIENTERYTLNYIMSARYLGASTLNYMEASFLQREQKQKRVGLKDVLTGETGTVTATNVVVAAGGWTTKLLSGMGIKAPSEQGWTRAYNIVVDRPLFGEYGVGLEAVQHYRDPDAVVHAGKRLYFMTPWKTGTVIGTVYQQCKEPADECSLSQEELARFIDEINKVCPRAELSLDAVTHVHMGILPAARTRGDDPAKHTKIWNCASQGAEGVYAVLGVKYTTAGSVARSLIKQVNGPLQPAESMNLSGWKKAVTPLQIAEYLCGRQTDTSRLMVDRLIREYGDQVETVMKCADHEAPCETLSEVCPVLKAEVRHAVRNEMAQKLSDVVFRRTDMGSFSYPGKEALKEAASIMAAELRWSDERVQRELAAIDDYYSRRGLQHLVKE